MVYVLKAGIANDVFTDYVSVFSNSWVTPWACNPSPQLLDDIQGFLELFIAEKLEVNMIFVSF